MNKIKENILISACLLGINCRYDGKNNKINQINKLKKYFNLIPFCPEVSGNLSIPRKPSEIKGDKVINIDLIDVTNNFNLGATKALETCKKYNIKLAILKEESPSCGVNFIHNGTFQNIIINGSGVTTKKLIKNNIKVISEKEIDILLEKRENENI